MKKWIILLLALLMAFAFSACGKPKKVDDGTIIANLNSSDFCNYAYDGVEFHLGGSEQRRMSVNSFEIDKRLTEDGMDEIWTIAKMSDGEFEKTSYIKLTYKLYTEGGWRLEDISKYQESVFKAITPPSQEELGWILGARYSAIYMSEPKVSERGFDIEAEISLEYPNCFVSGKTVISLITYSGVEYDTDYCGYNIGMDNSGLTVDWSPCVGLTWTDKTVTRDNDGLIWYDGIEVTFTSANGNDVEICGKVFSDFFDYGYTSNYQVVSGLARLQYDFETVAVMDWQNEVEVYSSTYPFGITDMVNENAKFGTQRTGRMPIYDYVEYKASKGTIPRTVDVTLRLSPYSVIAVFNTQYGSYEMNLYVDSTK